MKEGLPWDPYIGRLNDTDLSEEQVKEVWDFAESLVQARHKEMADIAQGHMDNLAGYLSDKNWKMDREGNFRLKFETDDGKADFRVYRYRDRQSRKITYGATLCYPDVGSLDWGLKMILPHPCHRTDSGVALIFDSLKQRLDPPSPSIFRRMFFGLFGGRPSTQAA